MIQKSFHLTLGILCLVMIGLWVRSQFIAYDMCWIVLSSDRKLVFNSYCGTIYIYTEYQHLPEIDVAFQGVELGKWSMARSSEVVWEEPEFSIRACGFEIGTESLLADGPVNRVGVCVPYWSLIIIFSFGWIAAISRRLKFRGSKKNCCECCGYDLRASPLLCPECGHIRAKVGG